MPGARHPCWPFHPLACLSLSFLCLSPSAPCHQSHHRTWLTGLPMGHQKGLARLLGTQASHPARREAALLAAETSEELPLVAMQASQAASLAAKPFAANPAPRCHSMRTRRMNSLHRASLSFSSWPFSFSCLSQVSPWRRHPSQACLETWAEGSLVHHSLATLRQQVLAIVLPNLSPVDCRGRHGRGYGTDYVCYDVYLYLYLLFGHSFRAR
mmetsp:Transcript_4821/g.8336  ORF Transcript_4821/g.8336 Transcript_4821/m.8336 type:complete len:212 (+) Transcript_4821:965-1600(+)